MRVNPTQATDEIRKHFESQEVDISRFLKNFKERFKKYDPDIDKYEFETSAGDLICELIDLFNLHEDMEIFYVLFERFKTTYASYYLAIDQVLANEFEDYYKNDTPQEVRGREIDMLNPNNRFINDKYVLFRKMNIRLFEDFFHRICGFEGKYVSRAINRLPHKPDLPGFSNKVSHTILLLHELGVIDHLRKEFFSDRAREGKLAELIANILNADSETVRKAIPNINSQGRNNISTPQAIDKVNAFLVRFGITKTK